MKNMLADGVIKADGWSFEISTAMNEQDFLSSEIKDYVHVLVNNAELRSYYTDPCVINGRRFSVRVYFNHGCIVSITLIPSSDHVSWENIEMPALLKDKAGNDAWLKDQFAIFAPAEYSWGTLESVLDSRGGHASIVMRYRK